MLNAPNVLRIVPPPEGSPPNLARCATCDLELRIRQKHTRDRDYFQFGCDHCDAWTTYLADPAPFYHSRPPDTPKKSA